MSFTFYKFNPSVPPPALNGPSPQPPARSEPSPEPPANEGPPPYIHPSDLSKYQVRCWRATDGRSVRPISPAVPKMHPLLIDIQEEDTSDDEPPRKRLYSTPQLSPSARPYWEKRTYDDIGWPAEDSDDYERFLQHHSTPQDVDERQPPAALPRPTPPLGRVILSDEGPWHESGTLNYPEPDWTALQRIMDGLSSATTAARKAKDALSAATAAEHAATSSLAAANSKAARYQSLLDRYEARRANRERYDRLHLAFQQEIDVLIAECRTNVERQVIK